MLNTQNPDQNTLGSHLKPIRWRGRVEVRGPVALGGLCWHLGVDGMTWAEARDESETWI